MGALTTLYGWRAPLGICAILRIPPIFLALDCLTIMANSSPAGTLISMLFLRA